MAPSPSGESGEKYDRGLRDQNITFITDEEGKGAPCIPRVIFLTLNPRHTQSQAPRTQRGGLGEHSPKERPWKWLGYTCCLSPFRHSSQRSVSAASAEQ